MRILYIGNFAKDDPIRGTCPNADWISDTFEDLGHQVTRWDEVKYGPVEILNEANKGDYSFLLVEEGRLRGDFTNNKAKGGDRIMGLFDIVMKETKLPIVSWLTNIFFGIMRREIQVTQNPIFKADIVFSTDGGHQEEFEKAGVNHVLLRQGIYGKEAYIAKPDFPTEAEVGFVGAIYDDIYPYRGELTRWLKRAYGDNFEQFGSKGEIRHDALNRLCAKLKIVVGDSVYSPQYWSNRVYEIIGRGGFLIMPKIPGLSTEFEPYQHYIPYTLGNFAQLKEIIDYYLTHDEEREKIRLAGFEHCRKYHTYEIRVEKLIKTLEDKKII